VSLWVAAAAATVTMAVPAMAAADLRIHVEGGGIAPMDTLLRDVGPGGYAGGAIDYEVVNLLSVGVFAGFNYFARDPVSCSPDPETCDCIRSTPSDPVYDIAAGGRMALRFVRHRSAGWFGADTGDLYGEAYLELDLAYHNLGTEHRIGWGLALGYRVLVAGPFGLGPVLRFRHVVAGEPTSGAEAIHQMYMSIGLSLFLSFDLTGDGTSRGSRGSEDEDDEWEDFESASD
jgi:hypothetical protein